MNTNFWNNSRDYVSEDKANTFMNPTDVAKVILDNIAYENLKISDIAIERNS